MLVIGMSECVADVMLAEQIIICPIISKTRKHLGCSSYPLDACVDTHRACVDTHRAYVDTHLYNQDIFVDQGET
jgi:hypothetical protein